MAEEMTLEFLRKRLDINPDNLDEELAKQASSYLFVAEKAVNAEMAFEVARLALDKTIAEVDEEIRLGAVESGRKVTEALITKETDRNSKVISKRTELIKARGTRDALKKLAEAWYMRKDMVIQIAIKQRAELESVMGSSIKEAA